MLAQDPALDAPPGPDELPAALDGGSPLLAGRDRELAELTAMLADACEGRGGVVLVRGPRGVEKTRLAAELAREALRRRMALDPSSSRARAGSQACLVAGRELTAAEWEAALPGQPYRAVCSGD